jgi:hypothetical protein
MAQLNTVGTRVTAGIETKSKTHVQLNYLQTNLTDLETAIPLYNRPDRLTVVVLDDSDRSTAPSVYPKTVGDGLPKEYWWVEERNRWEVKAGSTLGSQVVDELPQSGYFNMLYVRSTDQTIWYWTGSGYIRAGGSRQVFSVSTLPSTGISDALYIRTGDHTLWYWTGSTFKAAGKDYTQVSYVNELPEAGILERLYVRSTDNTMWRWNGDEYLPVGPMDDSELLLFVYELPSSGKTDALYLRMSDNTLWTFSGTHYVQIGVGGRQDVIYTEELPETGETNTLYILAADRSLWLWNGEEYERPAGEQRAQVVISDALPGEGAENTLYIRTSDHSFWYWTGTAYVKLIEDNEIVLIEIKNNLHPVETPDGDEDTFTVDYEEEYVEGSTFVYVNGVKQTLGTAYTELGDNRIQFSFAPDAGDVIRFAVGVLRVKSITGGGGAVGGHDGKVFADETDNESGYLENKIASGTASEGVYPVNVTTDKSETSHKVRLAVEIGVIDGGEF